MSAYFGLVQCSAEISVQWPMGKGSTSVPVPVCVQGSVYVFFPSMNSGSVTSGSGLDFWYAEGWIQLTMYLG